MEAKVPETSAAEVSLGFTGNYPLRMDSALRVAVPAKFKEVLEKKYGTDANQIVLVPDSGKVKALPLPIWQVAQRRLEELSEFDPSSEDYRSFILGNMSVCQLDAQNRIRLTP